MRLSFLLLSCSLLVACGGGATPLPSPEADSTPIPSSTPQPTATSAPVPNFPVIGYLPDYRELNPAWASSLTDIIYFSAEPRADGSLDTSRLTEETWQALASLKDENGIRVHISIGGWGRDGAFVEMSADPETRKTFIANLLNFLQERQLDGADFDWEFPQNDTEFEQYIALLTETKAALSPHGLLVSVALPAESSFPLGEFAVVDRVHLMSYDRGERHSTFEQSVADVEAFLEAGIPPEKLILGMPFYGRGMSSPSDTYSYEQIRSTYAPAPDVDEVGDIYFNGLNTIRHKVCYGIAQNLGGFMVWELGLDTVDESSLLQQIYRLAQGAESC
ncbi:MAG TPA: glycosyl hydrolase family 18 protein [Anaerolineales bacterium]|nr:glycosyl hydrolase family 18 protein [Anaerolineales bacterium]